MKFYVVLLFLTGLTMQLEAYVLSEQAELGDPDIRASDDKARMVAGARARRARHDHSLTIEEPDRDAGKRDGRISELVGSIVRIIKDAFNSYVQQPIARARTVHLSDTKKSLAYELNSDAILRGIEEVLSSPAVKRFAHEMARKAAAVYSAIEKEL